jgi:hypothetical protein
MPAVSTKLFVLLTSPALSMKKHARTPSQNSLPLIEEVETDIDMQGTPLDTPRSSTDEAEVPLLTRAEDMVRRCRAQAHVVQRLQALQFDAWDEMRNGITTAAPQAPYAKQIPEIGTVNPEMWMQVRHNGFWVLDRTYLGEINPHAFEESGILRGEAGSVERPGCVPDMYWKWLLGKSVDAGDWAEGWVGTEPTLVWIARWRDGELSRREWFGRGNVGFVIEEQIEEFEEEEGLEC